MFDWKSIKEKALSISDNLSAIADEISTSTKEIVADVKSKADDTLEDVMNIAKDASDKAVEIWESEEVVQMRNKARDIAAETGNKASEVWNSEGVTKFRGSSRKAMRVVTGMQAVEDRRKSIQTREEADLLKAEIEETNEALRDDMNEMLESFGKFRLEALSATVGKFLHCLEIMNQKAKGKEYEFLLST